MLKQADSLHIDLMSSKYVSCKYDEIKDTGILCTSLTGELYFKSNDSFYQWKINESVLIKGEWRIIDISKITILNDIKFLSEQPSKVSAFGTFSKAKVKVTLQPPPPIQVKPIPPPPKQSSRKKKAN